jgi:hypothetical protein
LLRSGEVTTQRSRRFGATALLNLLTTMKTKTIAIYFFVALLALSLVGCESCTCPPNVKLGDVRMKNPGFFPFKGGESFTFINKNGETMVFSDVSDKPYPNEIIISSLCEKAPISNQYTYYEGSPNYNLTYQAKYQFNTLSIVYQYLTVNTDQPDTVLLDRFDVTLRNNPNYYSLTGFSIVASTRGNDQKLKTKNIDIHNDSIAVTKDTLIFKTRFQKVYSNKRNPKLLYTEKYGIVAFVFLNEWWYLKI